MTIKAHSAGSIPDLRPLQAMLGRGDIAAATQTVEAIVRAHPQSGHAWQMCAMIRRTNGRLVDAIAALREAIRFGLDTAESNNNLGSMLNQSGDTDAAERAFNRAVSIDPNHAQAWINLGRLASTRGDHASACEWLTKATRLQPTSALAHSSLGNGLRRAGQVKDAVRSLEQAVKLDPRNVRNLVFLTQAMIEAGDGDRAREHAAAARRNGSVHPELMLVEAAAAVAGGQVSDARQILEDATRQFPSRNELHEMLARLIHEHALPGDPFDSVIRATELQPKHSPMWHMALKMLLDFRSYDRLIETARAARRAGGGDAMIEFAEAIALSETGQIEAANRHFRAAAQLSSSVIYCNAMARHALRIGDPSAAADWAQKGLAIDSSSQFAWAYLSLAWRLCGDPRELWLHDYDRFVVQRDILDPESSESAVLFETIRQLHRARRHPANQSLRGGTQTEGALFDSAEPVIQTLRASVMDAVADYARNLPGDNRHPFLAKRTKGLRIAGSWSVRLASQGHHIAHVHDAGWASSALHLVVPSEVDASELADNAEGSTHQPALHPGALVMGVPPVELGLDLPPRRVIIPRAGALTLFPSSMWHATVPFTAGKERLTVAFDIAASN